MKIPWIFMKDEKIEKSYSIILFYIDFNNNVHYNKQLQRLEK